MAPPKLLVWIGDDAGIDATFDDDEPAWATVRVILKTGHIVFGVRSPVAVARAVRHPEQDVEAEETAEHAPPARRHDRRPRRIDAPRRARPGDGDGRQSSRPGGGDA
jgi:hypothetical protein